MSAVPGPLSLPPIAAEVIRQCPAPSVTGNVCGDFNGRGCPRDKVKGTPAVACQKSIQHPGLGDGVATQRIWLGSSARPRKSGWRL